MSIRSLLLATTLLALPLAAQAQPVSGVYVNLGGGGNLLQDQQSRPSPGLGLAPKQFNWNVGAVGLGSVGYGFGNGLRVELEGDYRYNALHRFGGTVFPTVSGGERQAYGAMVNTFFDLDIGSPYVFPYFGVGAGYVHTELHKAYAAGVGVPFKFDATDSANSLGYQGILGASFPTPWVPGLSLTAEYRFSGVVDDRAYQGDLIVGPQPAGQRRGEIRLFNDYNHSLLLGVRYAFAVPPPPVAAAAPAPASAPAPSAARTYLVFFDWDRAELPDRARAVVAEAAQASTRVATTRIEVDGYTDRSGTPAYNRALSLRRAQAVSAELVRDGVPRGEIAIEGRGDADPLVPTASGVREPQNRRVQIILR